MRYKIISYNFYTFIPVPLRCRFRPLRCNLLNHLFPNHRRCALYSEAANRY